MHIVYKRGISCLHTWCPMPNTHGSETKCNAFRKIDT